MTIVGSANGRSMRLLMMRLAGEVVAHQHPGHERAHHGIDEHDDERRDERQLEGGEGLRAGHRRDERVEPLTERLPDERRDGDEDDEPEVERGEAGAQKAPAVVASRWRPAADAAGRSRHSSSLDAQVREDLGHDPVFGIEELGTRLGPATEVTRRPSPGWSGVWKSGNWASTSASSGRKPWLP